MIPFSQTVTAYSLKGVLEQLEQDKQKPKLGLLKMINRFLVQGVNMNPIEIRIYNIYLKKEDPKFLEDVLNEYRQAGWDDIQVIPQDHNTTLLRFTVATSQQIARKIEALQENVLSISTWLSKTEDVPFLVKTAMEKEREDMKRQIKLLFVSPFEVGDDVRCNVENESICVGLEGSIEENNINILNSGEIESLVCVDWEDGEPSECDWRFLVKC